MVTDHAYYPLQVEIAAYLANEWDVYLLLVTFFGGLAAIVAGTKMFVERYYGGLEGWDKEAIWWFVVCEFPSAHFAEIC